MTVVRGLTITILTAAAFAIAGAAIGYALGASSPDYYRYAFGMSPDAKVDMAQFGLALGLSQGLLAGVVTGLVIVVCVTWHRSCTATG